MRWSSEIGSSSRAQRRNHEPSGARKRTLRQLERVGVKSFVYDLPNDADRGTSARHLDKISLSVQAHSKARLLPPKPNSPLMERPLKRHAELVLFTMLVAAAGCIAYVPPPPESARPATSVAGSYDSTWAAVVSYFADRNLPIRTIEKASGIIVAEALRSDLVNRYPVLEANGKPKYRNGYPVMGPAVYANCGSYGGDIDPASASFNVRVLGDATRSTVRVTTRFRGMYGSGSSAQTVECTSTGKFESDLEAMVKKSVEQKR